MSTARTEKAPQPSNNNIGWVIPENQMSALDLPIPILVDNRRLSVTVEGNKVAMGIFALPPKEPSISAFWAKILQKAHSSSEADKKLSPTQLSIEPKIDFGDAQRGLHTPLSVLYPYVVMEDGTRYGIGVSVPKEWTGKWSEPKERPEEGYGYFNLIDGGTTEIYRQKNGIALLVRLNGDTPLAESQTDLGIKGLEPSRSEMLIEISESTDDSNPYISALISRRQVLHPKKSSAFDLGEKQTEKADVSDLEFHVIAQRGTEENATFDNKGLVEVIVARCVIDEVIEKITKPQIISDYPFDNPPSVLRYAFNSELTLGNLKGPSIPDSTRKGETKFINERRGKVSIESVRDIKPIARFKLALVGAGGPITKSMKEAPEPSH